MTTTFSTLIQEFFKWRENLFGLKFLRKSCEGGLSSRKVVLGTMFPSCYGINGTMHCLTGLEVEQVEGPRPHTTLIWLSRTPRYAYSESEIVGTFHLFIDKISGEVCQLTKVIGYRLPPDSLNVMISFFIFCLVYFHMCSAASPFSGQIQPPVETVTCPEEHGPEGGGVLVLQAHAGQRPPPDTPHGNAPRQKEINQPSRNPLFACSSLEWMSKTRTDFFGRKRLSLSRNLPTNGTVYPRRPQNECKPVLVIAAVCKRTLQ